MRGSPANLDAKRYATRRAILAMLDGQKFTADELAAMLPITGNNVRHNLRALRKLNLARICGWADPEGRGLVPALWTAGSEPDARPPSAKKRRSATWKRHYAKNRMIYKARRDAERGIAPNPFAGLLEAAR